MGSEPLIIPIVVIHWSYLDKNNFRFRELLFWMIIPNWIFI
jgi:hypothetical protein